MAESGYLGIVFVFDQLAIGPFEFFLDLAEQEANVELVALFNDLSLVLVDVSSDLDDQTVNTTSTPEFQAESLSTD